MHVRCKVISGMDEVKPCYSISFTSRHDSIAKILIFILGLHYHFVFII